MSRYTFICEDTVYSDETKSKTTKEFEAHNIGDVIEEFKEFLLGVGFAPKTLEKYGLGDEGPN